MKQMPEIKNAAMKRIFIMPFISLGLLAYGGSDYQKMMDNMANKYLQGISDHEIANFDQIY